jgi:hypothetical protein
MHAKLFLPPQPLRPPLLQLLLLLLISGGAFAQSPDGERPTMNLPHELRCPNWGGGSCVHASTVMLLRWQGQSEVADWWRSHYQGGEYAQRLNQRLAAAHIRYAYTTKGDVEFLDWALRTRRGAGVTFWPGHAVNLVHLDAEWAGLLDNNRLQQVIWIPRAEFISRWRGYGGWGWTVVYTPPPPLPIVERR